MALTNYLLGDLIELLSNKNSELEFGIDDVRGVNNQKKLIPTKANLFERDLSKFQIVNPGEFFFNHRTSRNGAKFSITYNYESKPIICTEDYVVFKIKNDSSNIVIKEWLYMFFNRSEFDRYVITNSWGSSTEFYNWEDLCSIELTLPDYDTQKEYVDLYNNLKANQACYERGLADLELVCNAFIDANKSKDLYELGNLIIRQNNKNTDFKIKKLIGVGKDGFIPPKQGKDETNGHICYLVNHREFVFAPPQIHKGSLDLYMGFETVKCSDAYCVFKVLDENVLYPEYLKMYLKSPHFQHYASFYRDGVREQFDFEQLKEHKIPLPKIEEQKAVVEIYNTFESRKRINEKLKSQINDICPLLIKGSLEKANA